MNTNINLLVVWNALEKSQEKNLVKFLNELLFKNKSKITPKLTLVFSEVELDSELNQKDFSHIIVLCELTWEGRKYSDFYGIELVQKQIRVKNENRKPINLPILFVSFCSREQIIKIDQTKEIINTYGLANHFIQLPKASETEIFNFWILKPASELEMIDTLHFCAYDRMIASIRHGIGTIPLDHLKHKIFSIINKIDYNLKLTEIQNNFKNCNSTETFKLLCDKLEELMSVSSISFRQVEERGEFKVLLVDDETTDNLKALINEATPDVHIDHFNTTTAALQTLKDDFLNDYQVVISDYRIYDNPESITKQTMLYPQGYTFIEQSAKLGHLYKYISFSGLPRAFRIAVAEKLNIRIETVDKELMTSTKEGRKAFIEKIIDLSIENIEQISSLASDDYYFKTLSKRILLEKISIEEEVAQEAINLIDVLNEDFDNQRKNEIILNPNNAFATYWNSAKSKFSIQSETDITKPDNVFFIDELTKLVKAVKANQKKYIKAGEVIDHADFSQFVHQTIEDNSKLSNENNIYDALDAYGKRTFNEYVINNNTDDNKTIVKDYIYPKLIECSPSLNYLKTKFENNTLKYKDPYTEDALEKFVGKLIVRRFAIYCFYWLSQNYDIDNISDVSGLNQAVNRLLVKGYLKNFPKGHKNYISDNNVCSKSLFLCVRKPHKDIKELHQIAMTNEEKNFFRINYPGLYEKWNK